MNGPLVLTAAVRSASSLRKEVENSVLLALGLMLGAITTTAGLAVLGGFVSWIPPTFVRLILLAVCVVAAAKDLKIVHFNLPENARMIPQEVFGHGVRRGAIRFGFELGLGFRTYIVSACAYGLAICTVVLAGSTGIEILLVGVGFALGRACPLLERLLASERASFTLRQASADYRMVGALGILSAALLFW